MSRRLPKMRTDRAAKGVLKRDLSGYLTRDNFVPTSFEFAPKDKSITLRVSSELLAAVRVAAKRRGVDYQKLIREAIEHSLKKSS